MILKFLRESCAFFLQKDKKNKMDIEQILKQELERANLINKLKKISKKPDLKIYVSRVDKKKRKRIIINNRKEFSEKYLYL